MAQQTAVEWFYDQITRTSWDYKTVEQALVMEKEQRIKDYNAGYDDAQCNHINDAENYVNEQEYLNDKSSK